MDSFGIIGTGSVIKHGLRNSKGTDESFLIVDSLIPLMHQDKHHLGTSIHFQSCHKASAFSVSSVEAKKSCRQSQRKAPLFRIA